MNKEKRKIIFSVFLAAIIIGSVLSIAFSPRFKPPEQPKPKPTPQQPIESFKAEEIDANVEQLTSTYVLYGQTTIANPYELISKLKSIKSVREVYNPNYSKPEQNKLAFFCDILLESDSNIESILKNIEEKGILSNAEAYVKAMLKLPAEITLHSVDANKTKEFKFDKPFVIGVVSLATKPGDQLKVNLYLQLQGDALVKGSAKAYETKNLSATPRFYSQDVNAAIASLEPKFVIAEQFSYNGFDLNVLESELNGLDDVNNASLSLKLREYFYVSVPLQADENTEELKNDLNAAIRSIENINNVEFERPADSNILKIKIFFKSSEHKNYAYLKGAIASVLSEKGIEHSIENVDAFISATLSLREALQGEEAGKLSDSIKQLLSSYGIEASIAQPAKLTIETIIDPDKNIEIPLKENVDATLLAGHSVGETVNVKVNFMLVREEVSYIEAMEPALLG